MTKGMTVVLTSDLLPRARNTGRFVSRSETFSVSQGPEMMIRIQVTSYKGRPPSEALGFDFDESGGSIGRRDSNHLVLRDPTQQISREQARVVFRNGGFELVDQGMSPTLVNGRALGNSQSIALRPGDELQIGDYSLVVVDPTRQGKAP